MGRRSPVLRNTPPPCPPSLVARTNPPPSLSHKRRVSTKRSAGKRPPYPDQRPLPLPSLRKNTCSDRALLYSLVEGRFTSSFHPIPTLHTTQTLGTCPCPRSPQQQHPQIAPFLDVPGTETRPPSPLRSVLLAQTIGRCLGSNPRWVQPCTLSHQTPYHPPPNKPQHQPEETWRGLERGETPGPTSAHSSQRVSRAQRL